MASKIPTLSPTSDADRLTIIRLSSTISLMKKEVDSLEVQVKKLDEDKRDLEEDIWHYQKLNKVLKKAANKLEDRLHFVEAQNSTLMEHNRERGDVVMSLMMEVQRLTDAMHDGREEGPNPALDQYGSAVHCKEIIFHTSPWHSQTEVKEQDDKYYWRAANSGDTFQALEDPDPYRCSICRELFVEGDATVELPCKHRYHNDCVEPFCRTRQSCPQCTTEFAVKAELVAIELDGQEEEEQQ
ncbi:hypothetical protein DV736_g5062, partial [Chaetothyriales sp. CBS 134916]